MSQKIKWVQPSETIERQETLSRLQKDPRLSHLSSATLKILINRGMDTYEKIQMILADDVINQHNPTLMKDSEQLIIYLEKAIEEGKHIVVYGDFDNDGACATAISVLCLRELGGHVDYFINNRFIHGYGITPLGVEDLIKRYPTVDVILTVDNGIVAFEGVQAAINHGIQVLVTDHHEPKPDGTIPPADAVVDPKRLDDEYPFKGICGATVAYKMMMYLYAKMGQPLDYVYSMVDIVGMATVGDVMPLVDENRLFVKESIKLINKNPRYVFQALKDAIGVSSIDEGTFGFKFVPMVNSIGRLTGEIDKAVDMFLSKDPKEVNELVQYLVETNEKRKQLTEQQEKLAITMVEQKGIQPVIVLAHENFHQGIVGLVAGRIKEMYHRPTIVMTKTKDGIWKGSGRSIEAFSIIQALHQVASTTHHYGGHDMACGVGVEDQHLQAFEQAMIQVANDTLQPEDFIPKIIVDVVVKPNEVTEQLVEELETLKPFGTNFELPNIAVSDFKVRKQFRMGSASQHLKLSDGTLTLIMWSGADYYFQELGAVPYVQAIGTPSLNFWNGRTSVQMVVKDDNLRACSMVP